MSETNDEVLSGAIEVVRRTATRENGFSPLFIGASGVIIEQVERVQELEKEVEGLHWRNEWIKSQEEIGHLEATVQDLKASCNVSKCLDKFTSMTEIENKRLREALQGMLYLQAITTDFQDYVEHVERIAVEALEESK